MSNSSGYRLYVIAYDVRDDRQRARLYKLLQRYGEPIQKSLFEARLRRQELRDLTRSAARCLREPEDSLIIYPIHNQFEDKIIALGRPRPRVEIRSYFIV